MRDVDFAIPVCIRKEDIFLHEPLSHGRRFPRRLAEESEWFLEMAELIVSDKESFFILHGKIERKTVGCGIWTVKNGGWQNREQNDFRLPQSARTCTVSAASPLTECMESLVLQKGFRNQKKHSAGELNIHIW